MDTSAPPPPLHPAPVPGFVPALRRVADGLLASVQDRIALLGLEFEAEKARIFRAHLQLGLALMSGLLALTFASLTLLYLLWERAPLATLMALTAGHASTCALLCTALRRTVRTQPRALSATLEELTQDRKCLQPER
jgi:uncharacterized membrane protein YqjE